MEEYDYAFKFVIIGDIGVGKSSIVTRYFDNDFNPNRSVTIGPDFRIKTLDFDEKKVKLQLWDTAGIEKFHSITSSFYRKARGIIIVYDVDDKQSFDNIQKWFDYIKEHAPYDAVRVLVGNKIDLNNNVVTYDMGLHVGNKNNMQFFETSVKNDIGVHDVFQTLIKLVIEKNPQSEGFHHREILQRSESKLKLKSKCF
ncbi:MAG: hypothetical protein Terrestrivirus1_65 [Terrestrivirus sp.]|uniref:Uncharacterized protein n=1 Tax=Terrestrivirus sp. TaxID=2487775 RepID=A0A3G4ZMC5_9VIRU|nr:MAG: hypothetical protein Terrestrivirus1_65 [Terrestrivirus sp.]